MHAFTSCIPCTHHTCAGHTPTSRQVDITFHDVDYQLSVATTNGQVLNIEIEQKSDASRWRGDFSCRCELAGTACSLMQLSVMVGTGVI